tara:strand:- start:3875 stop:6481 length:2607 start_codon:yes stop_codon:yes gene_type:complete
MAQKRTQVSRLSVDDVSTKSYSSPVDTYVRPIETKSTPSALSQFVSAISPVAEAVANKELEVKLKREREIDSQRLQSKYKQADLKAYEMSLKVDADYKANPDVWHQKTAKEITDKLENYQFTYLDNLPEDTDPLIKESMKLKFQEYNIVQIANWNKGKTDYNKTKLDESFKDLITLELKSGKPNSSETIQQMINDFAIANPTSDGNPDFKRSEKNAFSLLVSISNENANNPLYDALNNMKTKDGKKISVLNKAANIELTSKINVKRAEHIKIKTDKEDNTFKNSISYEIENNKIDAAESIRLNIAKFATEHPLPNGNPDWDRAYDNAISLAKDISSYNPVNPLYDALINSKTSETSKPVNILKSGLFAKDGAVILKNHARQLNTNLNINVKNKAINDWITKSIATGSIHNKTYMSPKNELKTFSEAEIDNALPNHPSFTAQGTNKLALYRKLRMIPSKLKNSVLDALGILEGGNKNDEASNLKLQQGYKIWKLLKNSNNNLSFVNKDNPDAHLKFEALDHILTEQALSGERIDYYIDNVNIEEETGAQKVVTLDYNNAANIVQNMDFKVPVPSKALTKVEDALKDGFDSDLLTSSNASDLQRQVSRRAHFLIMGGVPEKDAFKAAREGVEKDHLTVESSNGTQYSFKSLDTDPNVTSIPTDTINEYNKQLGESKIMNNKIFQSTGLTKGQYNLALYPDISDPNKISIRLFSLDGTPRGQLGNSVDKYDLFNNEKKLKQLIADVKMEKQLEVTNLYNEKVIAAAERKAIAENKAINNSTKKQVKKATDDLVEYVGESPAATLNLVKTIGDNIVKATESKNDFVTEVKNPKKIGDDLVKYVAESPAAAVKSIQSLFSEDTNPVINQQENK